MAFSISYLYVIQDRYTRKLNKIKRVTDKFTKTASKATGRVSALSKKMNNLQAIAGAAAVGLAAAFPVKKAIDFEFAMADVLKVLDNITPKQLQDLEKQIFKSSIAMGRLPKDIAAVVAAGGRLGIPLENLGAFTKLASKVAVAFDITESIAGDSLASITDKLGLTMTSTGNLMDAINHLADNTSAKAGNMIEIIGRISGTMKTVEMPPEFIAGWAALADRVEVTPRLAASGMRMMMRAMKGMPGMMTKLLKDPNKTMAEYLKTLAKIEKKRLPKVLEKRFGAEAAGFVEKLVGKMHLLDQTLGLVADKTKLQGSMQRELNKKLSTSKVKIDQVKSAFTVLAIAAGTAVLPVIKAFSPILIKIGNSLSRFAEAHPKLMKIGIIIGIVTAAFSGLLVVLGVVAVAFGAISIPIAGIIAGLAGAIAFASTLYVIAEDIGKFFGDAFSSLKSFLGLGSPEVIVRKQETVTQPVTGGVAGNTANAMQGTLNGQINIIAKGAIERVKASMTTDVPGDLGMNMEPQGAR
jgi:TP901 family phage tail tape measure protein